jgi:hypothetical protein
MVAPTGKHAEPDDLLSFVRQDRATVVIEFPELRSFSRLHEGLVKVQLQKPGLFPNVTARAKSPQGEGLVLVSESNACQLVILPAMAQLQVGFYGNFEMAGGLANCIAYLDNKIRAVLALIQNQMRQPVRTLAVVFDFKLSSHGLPLENDIIARGSELLPLVHPALDLMVFDYQAKVAYEVEDTFFVNVSVSVYETMTASVSSSMAKVEPLHVHPHQLRRADRGLQFTLDANTRLLARRELSEVTSEHWVKMTTFVTEFRQTTIRRILKRLTSKGEP